MSRIEDLIKEKCPNGVKFISIKDLCKTLSKGTLKTSELLDEGYPVINSGRGLYGYYSEYNNEGPAFTVAARGEYAAYVNYFDSKFWAGGLCYPYTSNNESIALTKFIYYFLKNIEKFMRSEIVSEGSIPALNKQDLERITIPVPPIEVQEEIVKILDKFDELKAELETELEARQIQYEFWCRKLLNNDNKNFITLGNIGKVCMCKRIMKNETSSDGDIPFYKIGTFGKQADAYISRQIFEKYRRKYSYPKVGDILISCSGTIGRSVVFDGHDSYYQDSNIVWIDNDESKVLNKFLYYFYQLSPWKIETGGTINRLYTNNIVSVKIPLYTLEEQEQIVNVLDKFDKLVNDISEGLPAEIESRIRQYEYYRDRLLSFEELSVND